MSDPRQAYEQSQALRPDAPDFGASGEGRDSDPEQATEEPDEATETDATAEAEVAPSAGDSAGDEERTDEFATRDPAELAAALVEAETQRDEYLDHLRRERAEFDNFRKRNAKERLEAMDRGIQSLATELLGVLDNFGHVLAAAEGSSDEALAKGASMVHEELIGVLRRFGLEEVPGKGSAFDPQWHEAMMQVAAEEDLDEPIVAEVLRTGYSFKGRVLRPASVSVAG